MTKKVLLIDDDKDIIVQNKMILESKGYTVKEAYSAKEGLETLESYTPDVIVLDVMMEYWNAGLELARKVATTEKFKNVPIILLTSDAKNPNWLHQDGHTWDLVVKYLDKPVKPDQLLKIVESLTK